MNAPTTPLASYTEAQIRKAITLIKTGHVRHVEHTHEYLVTASDGVTRYICDAYRLTCTCRAGELGRHCYHLAAAIALADGTHR